MRRAPAGPADTTLVCANPDSNSSRAIGIVWCGRIDRARAESWSRAVPVEASML